MVPGHSGSGGCKAALAASLPTAVASAGWRVTQSYAFQYQKAFLENKVTIFLGLVCCPSCADDYQTDTLSDPCLAGQPSIRILKPQPRHDLGLAQFHHLRVFVQFVVPALGVQGAVDEEVGVVGL